MSSAVMVSGIDICFSTDSLEYRSSRRMQMSSELALEIGVTCAAVRSCLEFKLVIAGCHGLTFLVRDLAVMIEAVGRRE